MVRYCAEVSVSVTSRAAGTTAANGSRSFSGCAAARRRAMTSSSRPASDTVTPGFRRPTISSHENRRVSSALNSRPISGIIWPAIAMGAHNSGSASRLTPITPGGVTPTME